MDDIEKEVTIAEDVQKSRVHGSEDDVAGYGCNNIGLSHQSGNRPYSFSIPEDYVIIASNTLFSACQLQ